MLAVIFATNIAGYSRLIEQNSEACGRRDATVKEFNEFLNWDLKIAVKYLVPVTAKAFPYPNMITLVTLVLAVAGVSIMSSYLMAGVTLFFLGRFLDNVDGEVARVTGKTSNFGANFDRFTGTVSFVSLFLVMGSGYLAFFGAMGAVLNRYPRHTPVTVAKEENQFLRKYLPFSRSGALKYWLLAPIALIMGNIDLWLQISVVSYWILILVRLKIIWV